MWLSPSHLQCCFAQGYHHRHGHSPMSKLLPSIAGLLLTYSSPLRSNRQRCSLPLGFGSGLHRGEGLLVGTQSAIALFRYVASSTAHCHGARRKDFNRYRMTTAMTDFVSFRSATLRCRSAMSRALPIVLLSAMPARTLLHVLLILLNGVIAVCS